MCVPLDNRPGYMGHSLYFSSFKNSLPCKNLPSNFLHYLLHLILLRPLDHFPTNRILVSIKSSHNSEYRVTFFILLILKDHAWYHEPPINFNVPNEFNKNFIVIFKCSIELHTNWVYLLTCKYWFDIEALKISI